MSDATTSKSHGGKESNHNWAEMNRFTHVMESGFELCVVIKHAAQFQQFRTLVPISAALLQCVNRAMIDTMHHRHSIVVAVAPMQCVHLP